VTHEHLRVDLADDGVATVEIARPPNNFFDVGLIAGIADELETLAGRGCRAVVLCSEGRHFCAGADFSGSGDPSGGADGTHLYDHAVRIFEQPVPIVAAVQGAAIGGGLGLALAADFRVASPEARFSANFARLGFHHGFGLTVTLPAAVGQQPALDLLYTGRRLDGDAALAIGLCDRLAPLEQVRAEAIDWAREIAASAPLAVRSIRETMRAPITTTVRAAMARERAEQDRLTQTDDWREGIAASMARRDPTFGGT
jgi:2-(1,2-epoxy-1,2-dihydrophenyl)acetyl-CoA isomerase